MKFSLRSTFVKNVATMMAGNASAQAIAFLAAPIVTRLYGPADFGIMTFIWSLTGLFSVGANLGYHEAVILPASDEKGKNLFLISITSALVASLCVALFTMIFSDVIASKSGMENIDVFLWFVPVGIFFVGCNESFISFHTRYKHFRLISISTIAIALTTALTKIIPALFVEADALWLNIGNVAGPFIAVVLLFWMGRSLWNDGLFPFLSIAKMRDVAVEYIKFPLYQLPTLLINSLSQSLPVILFAAYFSPEVVGFYGLANKVLRQPIYLIGDSLKKIFLQKSAETEHVQGNHFNNLKRTILALSAIGIVPFVLLTLYGKQIFVVIFGAQWSDAGVYAQLLSPWLFTMFLNPPVNQIYLVKQKLGFLFWFNIVTIVLRLSAIIIGYYFFKNPFVTIGLFSLAGVILNIFFISNAFLISRNR